MNLKKFILISIIPLWIFIALIEIAALLFLPAQYTVRRAWEVVTNYDGKDGYRIPFKPNYSFVGVVRGGDLLNWTRFKYHPEDLNKHVFTVDEYGFRNSIGLFKKGVEAVMMGNSYVGGSQETQDNLITEILTTKYNIPSYNYALKPLQFFWEDTRFIRSPPKYVIVVGVESEIIGSNWIETVVESSAKYDVKEWSTYEEWRRANEVIAWSNFVLLSNKLKSRSAMRFYSNKVYIDILNTLFNRKTLAEMYKPPQVKYDSDLDMSFFTIENDNPKFEVYGVKGFISGITTLKNTQEVLAKRGITLIVVAVPSKGNLYSKEYKNIKREDKALPRFETEMEKNGIEHVKLYDSMYANSLKGKIYFFKDDTHWNSETNILIAQLLASKIKLLEKQGNLR